MEHLNKGLDPTNMSFSSRQNYLTGISFILTAWQCSAALPCTQDKRYTRYICKVAHFQKITITTGHVETQILFFTVPIYQRKCMVPNILVEKFAYLNYRMFFELGQISQEWVPKGVKFLPWVKFDNLVVCVPELTITMLNLNSLGRSSGSVESDLQTLCSAKMINYGEAPFHEVPVLSKPGPSGTNKIQNLVDDNVYNDI